jgi:uncharacterized protein
MTRFDAPFHFDGRGRTATTNENDYIRDLIEDVLFTAPGERVNRPTYGSALRTLVFAPASETLAAAAQFSIQGALQQWLGDLIIVEDVTVEAGDARVLVNVRYIVRATQERQTAQLSRGTV